MRLENTKLLRDTMKKKKSMQKFSEKQDGRVFRRLTTE